MKIRYPALAVSATLAIAACSAMVPAGDAVFDAQDAGQEQPFHVSLLVMGPPDNAATCIKVLPNQSTVFRACRFALDVTGDLVGDAPDGRDHVATLTAIFDADGNGHAVGAGRGRGCIAGVGCGTFASHFRGPWVAGNFGPVRERWRGTGGALLGMDVKFVATNLGNSLYDAVGTIEFDGRREHDDDDDDDDDDD